VADDGSASVRTNSPCQAADTAFKTFQSFKPFNPLLNPRIESGAGSPPRAPGEEGLGGSNGGNLRNDLNGARRLNGLNELNMFQP
jgi:hypothetical protein